MMKGLRIKIITLALVLAVTPVFTRAASFSDLNIQIAELLAQVFTLKAQINGLEDTTTVQTTAPRSPSDLSCIRLERNMAFGDRGGDVTDLQLFLARDSYIYPEALITGYYGSATRRAVERWQTINGVISYGAGYGVVGPKTRTAMGRGCEPVTEQDTTENDDTSGDGDVLIQPLEARQALGNSPFNVDFNFTLSDKCVSYYLDWGDGSAPLEVNAMDELCDGKAKQIRPNHVYPRNGVYTATLRAGMNYSTTQLKMALPIVSYKAIVVGGNIKPFSVSPLTGGSPLTVTAEFTLEHPACTSYSIDWGDGKRDTYETTTFACSRNIQHRTFKHTYTTPGSYEITFKKGGDLLSNLPIAERWLVRADELQPGKVVIELTETSGRAPLTVRAKLASNDGVCTSYEINWGDGTPIQRHEWLPPQREGGGGYGEIAEGDFVSADDGSFVSLDDQGFLGEDLGCIDPFSREFSHTYVSYGAFPLTIKLGKGALRDITPAQHWVSVFK